MMRLSFKIAWVAAILVLLGIAGLAVHRHRSRQATALSQLYSGIAPIPKGAPRITPSAHHQLLSADFTVVTDLRYLPSGVKQSFCNVEECNYVGTKFDMVNPGSVMSTDYIIPGVPNKRLVFAALNRNDRGCYRQWWDRRSARATATRAVAKSGEWSEFDSDPRRSPRLRDARFR